jgi:hypothetical protein
MTISEHVDYNYFCPENCTRLWDLINQENLNLIIPRLLKLIMDQREIPEPHKKHYLPGLRLALRIIAEIAII